MRPVKILALVAMLIVAIALTAGVTVAWSALA